jgi:hypothetical protein
MHCCCAIIIIIPLRPLPGRRGGWPPNPPLLAACKVVNRVLGGKSWGRMMLFVIGDSVEASLSKWHLVKSCCLCSTCSVPATILAKRMHRFQYNAATEIDDNKSPGCILFSLSLQILFTLCWQYFVYFVCWRGSKESKIFGLMAKCTWHTRTAINLSSRMSHNNNTVIDVTLLLHLWSCHINHSISAT